MSKNERPEALAQFAESARRGERSGVAGLTATKATAPIPTDSKTKDEAAARVLREGATGEDLSADEYVDRLPDRILESRENSSDEALEGQEQPNQPYDATRDPRTGRPPQLGEAQRLAREHEIDRLSDRPAAAEIESESKVAGGEFDENDQETSENMEEQELEEPFQKPGRMASPEPEDGGAAAIEELVGQGISREQAEALVEEHGSNLETLKAVAWAKDNFEPKEEEGKSD